MQESLKNIKWKYWMAILKGIKAIKMIKTYINQKFEGKNNLNPKYNASR